AFSYEKSVIALAQKLDPDLDFSPCGDSQCVSYIVTTTCLTQNGRALPVGVCASRQAGMLGDGATAPVGPGGQGSGSGSQGSSGSGSQRNRGRGSSGSGSRGSSDECSNASGTHC